MSKKKVQVVPEDIHLFSITVFKGLLETSEEYLNTPVKATGYEFGVARDMAHILEEGLTRLRLYFTLEGRSEKGDLLGLKAEYGIEFHFRVDNFQNFVQKAEDGSIQIDATLGSTLIGIAYSTSRGIILERLQGTFFGGVILPVIKPFDLLIDGDVKEKNGK